MTGYEERLTRLFSKAPERFIVDADGYQLYPPLYKVPLDEVFRNLRNLQTAISRETNQSFHTEFMTMFNSVPADRFHEGRKQYIILARFWDAGWRPDKTRSRILNVNKNPYLK